MKKFVIRISLFAILFGIVDILFGYSMNAISEQAETGDAGLENYICNELKDDILVFGSSRAKNHYNTQMMTDSLGISCYNCGANGCGIILAYGRLLMLLERHTPKTIIYEVTPIFDYLDQIDNHRYLVGLKQHYNNPSIDSIILSVDPTERYKMISGMYRHNTSCWRNFFQYTHKPSKSQATRGFVPQYREMDTLKISKKHRSDHSKKSYVYDSLKINYINKFIDKTNGINLIFVVSPTWSGQDTLALDTIKQICKKKKIPFIDYSNSSKYLYHNEYFQDGGHLNARGADEFTRDMIHELRKRYY